jgi:ethanolamine transporter EutH
MIAAIIGGPFACYYLIEIQKDPKSYSIMLVAGTLLILTIFVVLIMASIIRRNINLIAFYTARADALQLYYDEGIESVLEATRAFFPKYLLLENIPKRFLSDVLKPILSKETTEK